MAASDFKYFIGLSSFEMLAMFRRGLFYAYLSIYLRHFLGLSVTQTTLFATLPMIMNILSQAFIWGRLSDYLQLRRSLIVIGELLAALATVLIWYVHRLFPEHAAAGWAIIIGLSVTEIFWSMSNIAYSALISDLYPPQERGRTLGRLTSMGGLGRIFGVWTGGFLYDGVGRHFAGWGFYAGPLFFISAGAMLVSTLPLFFLPEGGVRQRSLEPPKTCETADSGSTSFYIIFLIAMVFINFGRNSIAIIFTQYLTLQSGPAVDSLTMSYIVNTHSAAMVLLGWQSGRLGRRFGMEGTLLAATVVGITALLLLSVFESLAMLYVSSFLRGISDVIIMATAYAYASVLIPPEVRARRFAWFNATFYLSWGLAGTIIAGPLIDYLIGTGLAQQLAYRWSFAAAAVITLIGLFVLAGLVYRNKRAVSGAPV